MEKIRFGIVATGKIANKFAEDLTHSKHGVLGAVASRNIENAEKFANKFKCDTYYGSYEELYADSNIDVIYVATPHSFHLQNASDALKAGKPVLCEKPLTMNMDQTEELLATAQSENIYLMEGMWTYFLPTLKKAKEWIDAGEIGEVTQIRADFGFASPFDPKHRNYNPELAGGSMLDIGIYPIALNWFVMRTDPKDIIVYGKTAPTGVDSEVNMVFEYENSVSYLASSFTSKLQNTAYIAGTKGSIEIPNFWMSQEALLHNNWEIKEHFKAPRKSFGFQYEIDAVCKDIQEGKKQSEVFPHDYTRTLQQHMSTVLKKMGLEY